MLIKRKVIAMSFHYKKPFKLKSEIGNNKFSFDKRELYKEICISSLKESSEIHINESTTVAFAEMDNNKEVGFKGIDPFIVKTHKNKKIYVFDNHNHAFFFIYKEIFENQIPFGLDMIHIDQHKDTRTPDVDFSEVKNWQADIRDFLYEINYLSKEDINYEVTLLDAAFYYTNAVLNVGNFIKPLQKESLIENLFIVDSTYSLDNIEKQAVSSRGYILDIDLDFFSEDMDYIDRKRKIEVINNLAKKASLITICTSPFFIDFEKAKQALEELVLFADL